MFHKHVYILVLLLLKCFCYTSITSQFLVPASSIYKYHWICVGFSSFLGVRLTASPTCQVNCVCVQTHSIKVCILYVVMRLLWDECFCCVWVQTVTVGLCTCMLGCVHTCCLCASIWECMCMCLCVCVCVHVCGLISFSPTYSTYLFLTLKFIQFIVLPWSTPANLAEHRPQVCILKKVAPDWESI